MEKTNKYYEIIKGLVKKHKKFPGHEAILEDIIEDVYGHSEVIISHINNESVIQSYLEKVVSTSIITVPKKMHFHPEISHKVVSTEQILVNEVKDTKRIKVDNVLVDRMINSKETLPIVEQEYKNEDINLVESGIEEETSEEMTELEEILDPLTVINDNEQELSIEEESLDLPTAEEEVGLAQEIEPSAAEEEEISEEAAPIQTLPEETFVELQPEEEIIQEELVPEEEELNSEIEELQIDDIAGNEDELSLSLDEEPVTEILVDENQEQEPELNEIPEFEDLNSDTIELDEESSILTELDDGPVDETLLEQQEETLQDFSIEEGGQDLLEEPVLDLDISEHADLESSADLEIKEEPSGFTPVDYSVFEFNPEIIQDDIDVEDIAKDIIDLNHKRPELNIIKVYEMKYKDNSPVSQIALQLEMREADVLDALNEIIAII